MRHLTFLIIGLIFLHHLVMTGLYLLPKNPMKNYYESYVRSYMHPLFKQNWGLFAPEPASFSIRLFYRCEENQKWGEWKDPLSQLIREHQENRFSYRGKLIYIYQGLYRSLANRKITMTQELCSQKSNCSEVEDRITETVEFQYASKLVSSLCEEEGKRQFSLIKAYPKNFSMRNEPNQVGKMDVDLFPVFKENYL